MNDKPDSNKEEAAAAQELKEWALADGFGLDPLNSLPEDGASTSEEAVSVMVFRVKGTWLALKTSLFYKVADIATPHSVPGRTDIRFRGIVNAGGELELCFALADILGIPDNFEDESYKKDLPRLVVIGKENSRFAFAVAEIGGVRSIFTGDPPVNTAMPAGLDRDDAMPVVSVDGKTIKLLNEKELFDALTRSLPDGDG